MEPRFGSTCRVYQDCCLEYQISLLQEQQQQQFFSMNAHFCTVLKVVVAGLINGSTTVAWHITTYARGITLVCSLWSDLIC